MKVVTQLMTFLESYNVATKEEKTICDKIIQMSSIININSDFKEKIEKIVDKPRLEQNKKFYEKKKKQAAYMREYYIRKKREKEAKKPVALKFKEHDTSFEDKIVNNM